MIHDPAFPRRFCNLQFGVSATCSCLSTIRALVAFWVQVLKQLYDTDILTEDALLAWADEKANASVEERTFLKMVSYCMGFELHFGRMCCALHCAQYFKDTVALHYG